MALASVELIEALRTAARRLRSGANYAWGNHGACNCGQLLQVITTFNEKELLRFAQTAAGEWTELSKEYCSETGAPIDLIISKLQAAGLTPTDIHHIEYLSDREVLDNLAGGFRWLNKNEREHVIEYFQSFANLLEEQLIRTIDIDLGVFITPMQKESV